MPESYSVKARLSALDSGFTSTLKSCSNALGKFDSKINGLSFGFLTGVGQAAFHSLTNSVSGLIGEINSSNTAWKTFEGNMGILGKTEDDIKKVKGVLQDYAQQTIYSSSDMASTYAQLSAVGVKSADKLVKGFGGLAAAAENPTQAMKTLSQQATQMAGKSTVAWADFKLMLEQTPAGIAAVAKQMGKSTSELVKDVQAGTVATEVFFDAVAEVGTSDGFEKLATEYKTIDQAMMGLKETLGNKLTPAFDVFSSKAIKSVSDVIDEIGLLNPEEITTKTEKWLLKAERYWNVFKNTFSDVRGEISEAVNAIGHSVGVLNGAFGSTRSLNSFEDVMQSVAGGIKAVADFAEEHSNTIAKFITWLPKLWIAMKGAKIARTVAPGIVSFAGGIANLANVAGGGLASKLFGIGKSTEDVGRKSSAGGKKMLTSAKAFMMMGAATLMISAGFVLLAFSAVSVAKAGPVAIGVMFGMVGAVAALGAGMMFMLNSIKTGPKKLQSISTAFIAMGAAVLLIGAGFALLAYSSISLANAGWGAIGVMTGMVGVIALLAVGTSALGTALTEGAVGFLAFGAAILLVGTGVLIASAGVSILANSLPVIASYGLQGASALTVLGLGLTAFTMGAAVAGIACIALGAGLGVVALAIVGVSAGIVVLGFGMTAGTVGVLAMAAALLAVTVEMKNISKNAKSAKNSLKTMVSSISVVESGLSSLGSMADLAMSNLIRSFTNASGKAQKAGNELGKGYTQAVENGLSTAPSIASLMVISVCAALGTGRSSAYSAGAYISLGFAQGMQSQLGYVRSVAAQLASAADAAIRAKAEIHSPSDVARDDGRFYGKGYVLGILDMVKDAWEAAEKLVSFPAVSTPNLALAYGGEMSSDYEYYRNERYTFNIPVTVDGREVARATATYTQDELNRRQTRENRKYGRV